MLRKYLDQNKWIDFARAATGHEHGKKFTTTLAAVRAASASGLASFPLDVYRHIETAKHANDRSRVDVADLMHEISKRHTLARPHTLLPAEIDQAFQRRFGLPEVPRSAVVFGTGIRHITGSDAVLPSFEPGKLQGGGAALSGPDLVKVEEIFNDLFERELLRVGPNSLRESGFDPSETTLAKQYIQHEQTIAVSISDQNLSGNMLELAIRASDLGDIRPAVTEALERSDVTLEVFLDELGPAGLDGFVDDLPTRFVTDLMRSAKVQQNEQKCGPNDCNDILALPVAVVYCDVVVTEKQWINRLRQGNAGQCFNTILLSNVADRLEVLDEWRVSDLADVDAIIVGSEKGCEI